MLIRPFRVATLQLGVPRAYSRALPIRAKCGREREPEENARS
jgi:hypothetical protein